MDSTDLFVLKASIQWLEAGRRIALATVIQTWGSAPRPIGAWLAIRDDGQVVGSVSGGCVEDDLIDLVKTDLLTKVLPQVVVYGVSHEEAARFGLPCGGTLRLIVEPHPEVDLLKGLLDRISAKRMTARLLHMGSGKSVLENADHSDTLSFDGQTMRTIYGPRWRLVIIGAGQLSQYVAQMALSLDYEIIVIDPREEFASGFNVPDVTFSHGMPDDVVLELGIDTNTAIVALTHDRKLDDMALLEALKSPAFYIGALGSHIRTEKRKEQLLEFDITTAEIDRLHSPTGLYIGSNSPPEMAISILAEITAAKHNVPIVQKRMIPAAEVLERVECLNSTTTA